MARTLIVMSSYDPGYLRISEHLVGLAIDAGRTPIVLDITATSASPVDTYHRGVLRLFGLAYPGHDMKDRLSAMGAQVFMIDDVLKEAPEIALNDQSLSDLEVAIQSALITFYRSESPNENTHTTKRLRALLAREGYSAYKATAHLLSLYSDIVEVDVPNGRFPSQKMSTLAAQHSSVATMHFEKGETPDGAYFQNYSPQSRLLSQSSVPTVLHGLTQEESDAIADAWLSHRNPSKESRNEFSALWLDGVPTELMRNDSSNHKIAGLLTSSQDEYQSLGPEWQLHSWESQFEAFDAVLNKLERAGYHCYIRIHPNLATKSHQSFARERESIRRLGKLHPELLVIWHDDPTSTYSLLEHSDVVVTWDSTVGLEASARGIPVWTMATSRYGLVADVHEILSPEALEEDGLALWNVDVHAAKRFIAYMVRRDSPMASIHKRWTPWDEERPPKGVKLSRILTSGGNPTPRMAISSLVDVYRHRSIRSNLRSVLRR